MRAVALMLLGLALIAGCAQRTGAIRPQANPIVEASHSGERLHQAQSLAFHALSLVGAPYLLGGESPQRGFDCSGLVRFVYRSALGQTLPRTAAAQSDAGNAARDLRLGDLVFFAEAGRINHVGMYVGEARFVHAPNSRKTVQLSVLNGYWRERLVRVRRLL
jgi:cell wall-associated NlpC family hydrolase